MSIKAKDRAGQKRTQEMAVLQQMAHRDATEIATLRADLARAREEWRKERESWQPFAAEARAWKARALAAERARDEAVAALVDVADFRPVERLGKMRGEWCWCGDPYIPKEHQPYCIAARRILAASTVEADRG